ncbi:MAG: PIN domain-containing protein [Candidatus Hydrothermarchaeales archaeon]
MLLVVDANVVFSALIKGGKTFDIFLFNRELKRFKLVAPEFLLIEVETHIDEILEKTKLSAKELGKIIDFLEEEIGFVPFEEFRELREDAEQTSPDPDDVQYFALALKLGCTIWSNDKLLKQQSVVKVLSTDELVGMVGK